MSKRFYFDLFPNYYLDTFLFTEVTNSKDILKQLPQFIFACSNPQLIADEFQLLISANKTIFAKENNEMKTKNIHSELVYTLSASNNVRHQHCLFLCCLLLCCLFICCLLLVYLLICIYLLLHQIQISESFKKFGISETSDKMIVATFNAPTEKINNIVNKTWIQGKQLSLTDSKINQFFDGDVAKKVQFLQ